MNSDMLGFIARQSYLDDLTEEIVDFIGDDPEDMVMLSLPDDITDLEAEYIKGKVKKYYEL